MRYTLIIGIIITIFMACGSAKKTTTKNNSNPNNSTIPAKPNLTVSESNPILIMKGPDTITTASGLKYVILKHKAGSEKPKNGDKVSVNYRGKLQDGSEFDNSFKRGQPFEFQLGMGKVIKGWDEGIALLGLGDSAMLIIPPSLGYGNREISGIPANSTLYFDVELVKIKEPVFATPYNYHNKPEHVTASGLKYYVVKEGTGTQAFSGANVKVHYTGYLDDGSIFDSSVLREEPLEFKLGVGMVIKGWDEGILLMRQGAKYRFVIPPSLAYGEQGASGIIPANATLTFDCELVEVH
jgi:peptidylprolyl isomerase